MATETATQEMLRGVTDSDLEDEVKRRAKDKDLQEHRRWMERIGVIQQIAPSLLKLVGHSSTVLGGDTCARENDDCVRCFLNDLMRYGAVAAIRDCDAAPKMQRYVELHLSLIAKVRHERPPV